ncbi:MAG TPA: hypothetical protein VLA04_04765 [Verrucomicrobiae bacterium]|nr:hypothetical protein [Verrucomicrobiae bacterium]
MSSSAKRRKLAEAAKSAPQAQDKPLFVKVVIAVIIVVLALSLLSMMFISPTPVPQ